MDTHLQLSLKPHKQFDINLHFHHLRLAVEDTQGEITLGNELDLILALNPWKPVNFHLGGGVMMPDQALSNMNDGADDPELWLYVQTNMEF